MSKLKINTEDYRIVRTNYSGLETDKKQILVGNTNRPFNDFMQQLKTRRMGTYNKSPHFTIKKNGDVIQHFETEFFSYYLGFSNEADKSIISIALENVGWLKKNLTTKNFYDWTGKEYSDEEINYSEFLWKDKLYWENYTEEQKTSLKELIKFLCKKHNIDERYVGHNSQLMDPMAHSGIISKCNYFDELTEVNPTLELKKSTRRIFRKS